MSTGGLLVRSNALPQVRIGTQTWMAANYDFNGSDVNGVFTNVNNYGKLYTWTEANAIVYPGWHLPTYEEYQTLITYLGGDTVAGGKLKASGYWTTPNTGATNEVGFNARGSGWRGYDLGNFYGLGQVAMYFCGDVVDGLSNCLIHFNMTHVYARRADTSYYYNYRGYGCSIRLCRPATTMELPLADGTACDPYIGNDLRSYRTVKIGTQVWIADNLAETKYRNGDEIPEVTDNATWAALTTGARCSYNNDEDNAFTTTTTVVTVGYGFLYNWYAATDARNIAANGWHVAYYNDWRGLFFYLDPAASEYSEQSDPEWKYVESDIAGGPLKETGLVFWDNPNTGATNESGFNARGSGIYSPGGVGYTMFNQQAWFWTSSTLGGYAYVVTLTYTSASIFINGVDYTTDAKCSIRLLRDI